MEIENIVFNSSTDYADVAERVHDKVTQAIADECGCGCHDDTDKSVDTILRYLQAASTFLASNNTAQYQLCIKSAYFELRKLNC